MLATLTQLICLCWDSMIIWDPDCYTKMLMMRQSLSRLAYQSFFVSRITYPMYFLSFLSLSVLLIGYKEKLVSCLLIYNRNKHITIAGLSLALWHKGVSRVAKSSVTGCQLLGCHVFLKKVPNIQKKYEAAWTWFY